MTEQVEQWICIRFCIKLEHSSWEIIRVIQKAAAMATGDCWLHHHKVPTHASRLMQFFGVISNRPGDSALLPPIFGTLQLKLKLPLKRKRFQTVDEIQENTIGQLMVIGRTVWDPKVPTLKRTEALLFYKQCSLYLVSSSVNVFIFSYYMAGCFLDRLSVYTHTHTHTHTHLQVRTILLLLFWFGWLLFLFLT